MSVSRTHADKPSIIDVMWMLDFVWAFPGDVGLRSCSINARLRWLFVCYWSKPRVINSFRLATVLLPNEEIAVKGKRQAVSVWSSITFWSCRTNEALKWTPMDFYNVHLFFFPPLISWTSRTYGRLLQEWTTVMQPPLIELCLETNTTVQHHQGIIPAEEWTHQSIQPSILLSPQSKLRLKIFKPRRRLQVQQGQWHCFPTPLPPLSHPPNYKYPTGLKKACRPQFGKTLHLNCLRWLWKEKCFSCFCLQPFVPQSPWLSSNWWCFETHIHHWFSHALDRLCTDWMERAPGR